MGYKLRRDLREALGPDITGLQRAVALEIADDAKEETRISWVTLDDLARWTGAKDTAVVRNALKRLAAAGWEFRIPIGIAKKDGRVMYAKPGIRMTFRVPDFKVEGSTPKEGVATATPIGGATATPRGVATAHSEGATATSMGEPGLPLGGAGAHSEGATAHSEGAGATPYSSYSSSPQKEAAATQAPSTAPPSGGTREITEEDKREFGAFWAVHPKSRDMDKTRAEWIAAVVSGVDPKKITGAAKAYAHEVVGVDFKFIKQSAGWLRERRYEDKYEAALAAPKPPRPLPPWCGECADGNRAAAREGHLRQTYDHRGNAHPCPKCHPTQAPHAA